MLKRLKHSFSKFLVLVPTVMHGATAACVVTFKNPLTSSGSSGSIGVDLN